MQSIALLVRDYHIGWVPLPESGGDVFSHLGRHSQYRSPDTSVIQSVYNASTQLYEIESIISWIPFAFDELPPTI